MAREPRRSDATKAAILAAARERFATDGYERATIRAIAESANIDPAMVMRYFVNKEKLFVAAAEFDLRMPDFTAVPRAKLGAALVTHFLDRWEEDEKLMALLRAAATNESAAKRMQTIFASQVGPAIAKLSGDAAGAKLRAGLIASQLLGVAFTRDVLQLDSVVALPRAALVRALAPTIQRYLVGKLD